MKEQHMGPLGFQEMVVIFILALVLFGPKKLPELGRMLGKAVNEFRKAKNELRMTWEAHMAEIERETRETTPSYNSLNAPSTDYSHYSYSYEDYDYYGAGQPSDAHPSEPQPEAPAATPQISAPEVRPVAGTVARSNGVAPESSASAPANEEHPAA
ncbi:twin-arginine translocase TatA/TatE family subunit [Chthonomonas sp.]|uniref:Sec-independent protein translocase subunit TatA/TatB n=1 Tax=Chthonomonas sp. TaxID=2282153 RepID=UPI002B4AE23D|nr:twin-arginine translocase TatA/TatE family subunit [Chthonomonas sp.]